MNEYQAATVSAEMSAQRSTELAGDDRHYRLKKACMARAVELYQLLCIARSRVIDDIDIEEPIDQLLKEISCESR